MNKALLGRVLSGLFLIFLLVYAINNRELFLPLLESPAHLIILILLLKIFLVFLNGYFTRIVLDRFQTRITALESFRVSVLSNIGNYFGPILGGLGVRAVYLKKKYSFSYANFAGITYGYYLLLFPTLSLIGIVSLLVITKEMDSVSYSLLALLSGIVVVCVSLMLVKIKFSSLPKNRYLSRLITQIIKAQNGWERIAEDRLTLKKLVILNVVTFVIGTVVIYIEFLILGLPKAIAPLVIYSVLGSLSILVSFTPGAIGIRESIHILFSSVILITQSDVLRLSAIDRGLDLLVLTIAYLLTQIYRKRPSGEESDRLLSRSH